MDAVLFSETRMEWWDKLLEKLPSWRGIAYFWYVASHWENISRELGEYRKQIRDREEWAQRALEGQQVLHEQEKQRLEGELRGAVTRAMAGQIVAEQEAAEYRAAFERAISSQIDLAFSLGVVLSLLPPDSRPPVLARVPNGPREIVERVIARVQATAPPEPTPAPGLSAALAAGSPVDPQREREDQRSRPEGA